MTLIVEKLLTSNKSLVFMSGNLKNTQNDYSVKKKNVTFSNFNQKNQIKRWKEFVQIMLKTKKKYCHILNLLNVEKEKINDFLILFIGAVENEIPYTFLFPL